MVEGERRCSRRPWSADEARAVGILVGLSWSARLPERDNPPSDGQNVEIVFRDFQFVPLSTGVDAGAGNGAEAGGAGGTPGSDGAGGVGGRDGATGTDAAADNDRPGVTGGITGAGGRPGTGGSAPGGAMGAGGVATGGVVGVGGAVETGGAGFGGARSDAAMGTTSSGGDPGRAGQAGSPGAAGGGGTETPVGVTSTGGGSGANSGAAPIGSAARGCGYAVAGTRAGLGGRMLLMAIALLFARRYRRRRLLSAKAEDTIHAACHATSQQPDLHRHGECTDLPTAPSS